LRNHSKAPGIYTVAILIFLCACTRSSNKIPEEKNADPRGDVRTTIDCTGVSPEIPSDCTHGKGSGPVDQLLSAAKWLKNITEAIDAIEKTDLMSLSITQKIIVQNALLYLGLRPVRKHKKKIARLIPKLAVPKAKLVALGTEPDLDLDKWLGPRKHWQDRGTIMVPLQHEITFNFSRKFRPVRTGKLNAIFSQLVALDSEWNPYVVPIIGNVEILHGSLQRPKGCLADMSPSHHRCGAPAGLELEPLLRSIPSFVPNLITYGPGFGICIHCHNREKNAFITDLSGQKLKSHLARRNTVFMRELRIGLKELRQKNRP